MSKIIFIGDSITKGTGYGGVTAADTFAYKVGSAAGYVPADVINKGVGSDTSAGVLARLAADVLANSPDVCVLMIGVNDWSLGIPVATYANNVRQIIGQLKAAGIRPVVLSTMPNCGTNAQFDALATYVEALENIIAEMGAYYVDVHRDVMLWHWRKGAAAFKGLYADNVHPSKVGHQWIADKLMRPCNATMFAPGTVVIPDPVDPPAPTSDHLALTLALADLALGAGNIGVVEQARSKF